MTTMTKKHYVAIAGILSRSVRDGEMPQTVAFLASDLADYFEQDNPRFDRARFLLACGVEELTAAPAMDSTL